MLAIGDMFIIGAVAWADYTGHIYYKSQTVPCPQRPERLESTTYCGTEFKFGSLGTMYTYNVQLLIFPTYRCGAASFCMNRRSGVDAHLDNVIEWGWEIDIIHSSFGNVILSGGRWGGIEEESPIYHMNLVRFPTF